MSRCWSQGEWRAYLDGELEPAGMSAAREHLEDCAVCAKLLQEVDGRAHRVGAMMAALDREPEKPVVPRQAAVGGRRPAIVILALAAALAIAFLVIPKRTPTVRPAPMLSPAPVALAKPVDLPAPVPVRPHTPARRRSPKAQVDYYLGLDGEPIETGVVLRVALDGGLLADVIVDEQGRPRAVRPVNYEESGR